MKLFNALSNLMNGVVIIALIVVCVGGYMVIRDPSLLGYILPPMATQPGYTPTPPPDFASTLTSMPITPMKDNGDVQTAIPWTVSMQLGDAAKATEAIHSWYANKNGWWSVSTVNSYGGAYVYCVAQYEGIPLLSPQIDYNRPLKTQVGPGTSYIEVPGTRHCIMWILRGELYGGVVQSDLGKAPIYTLDTLPEKATGTFILIKSVNQTVVSDPTTYTVTYKDQADVELHVQVGLLTGSVQPKNQIPKTIAEQNGIMKEWADANVANGDPTIQQAIDGANGCSRTVADYDMRANINPDGSRDMSNLDQLFNDMVVAFNSPTPQGSSTDWPYDSIRQDMATIAKEAGYSDLANLKVVLELPDGQWVSLLSLEEHNKNPSYPLDPVVKPSDLDCTKHNLYDLYRTDIKPVVYSPGFLPDWVQLPFQLP